jgi:hypothetical protein
MVGNNKIVLAICSKDNWEKKIMKLPDREITCYECLKYPVCRGKELIECNYLNNLFNQKLHEIRNEKRKVKVNYVCQLYVPETLQAQQWNKAWDFIHNSFPNLKGITVE